MSDRSVRRAICSRRHYILVLLGLVLVCIVLQTLVARQTSNDKVPGVNFFPFALYKPHSFSLHSILGKFSSNSALNDLNPTTLYTTEAFSTAGVTNHRFSEFHIICNHMRFKKSEVAKVMPRDTFYFSILRNPVSMMESIFIYYKSIQAFNGKRTLDEFLNSSWTQYNSSVVNNHYAHNILAFDFGFNNNATYKSPDLEQQVSNAITGIERDFHLILINEYFYESMILLKHSLCWTLEDVASFKLNSRSDHTRRSLSSETVDKIKKWNALDWQIYLHFNATFWRKLDSLMGRRQLEQEVSELKAVQTKLAEVCLKEKGAVDPSKIKDAALKPFQYGAAVIQGYILNSDMDNRTREMCEGLIRPELQYTQRLYISQFQEGHKHLIKRRFIYFKAPQSARGPHNATAP
uniref:Galactose-3-O-sulfotransferase 2 n=1 Tax=Knipowitschia caucasica TaxID=637954 RepID=A0AAV2J2L1_KNICA